MRTEIGVKWRREGGGQWQKLKGCFDRRGTRTTLTKANCVNGSHLIMDEEIKRATAALTLASNTYVHVKREARLPRFGKLCALSL